jgi:hypothetical protein
LSDPGITVTPDGPLVTFTDVTTSGNGEATLDATPWALDETVFSVSFVVTFNAAVLRNEEAGVTDLIISIADGGTYGVRIRLHLQNDEDSPPDGYFSVGIGNTETDYDIDWVAGQSYGITFDYDPGGTSTVRLDGEGNSGTTPAGTVGVSAFVDTLYDEGSIAVTADTDTFCLLCANPEPTTGQVISENIGTGDGTETSFPLTYPWRTGTIKVWVDGLRAFAWEEDPPDGILFLVAPFSGEVIRVEYEAS